MTDRHLMTRYVQALEGEQVKALVLDWLTGTGGNLNDFEQLLEANYAPVDAEAAEQDSVYGELDGQGLFQPLTEAEMATKSLRVLEEYQRTGQGVPHGQVRDWLDGVGTDSPVPCPSHA
jgi:hypothetical protein